MGITQILDLIGQATTLATKIKDGIDAAKDGLSETDMAVLQNKLDELHRDNQSIGQRLSESLDRASKR